MNQDRIDLRLEVRFLLETVKSLAKESADFEYRIGGLEHRIDIEIVKLDSRISRLERYFTKTQGRWILKTDDEKE